jgi:hypothetical protein
MKNIESLDCTTSIRSSFRIGAVIGIALTCLLLTLRTVDLIAAQGAKESEIRQSPARASTVKVDEQMTSYPNCRFGVGGNVNGYDVEALNVGWFMDWSTQLSPPHPNGAEYVQTIRLKSEMYGYSFAPVTETLLSVIAANPGAIWLVGNEPDSPWQDQLMPEEYARAYHDLYDLIKQHDPSARIGVGNIVQPTPLRFQYLDRFLAAYRQYYGQQAPTDLWSIHSYILREIDASDPEACAWIDNQGICHPGPIGVWGAYIPPGITATRGVLYTMVDMFNPIIFRQRLIDFRTWMRIQGYRDTPLYVTEYGELFPYPPYIPGDPYVDENGMPITEDRVATFMTNTFDILLNTTDEAIGYPADENRLVQRWSWYSVSDSNYGGSLFDPSSGARHLLGDAFYSYTHAITPNVDLLAVRVVATPAAISDTGQMQTTTLKATISNIGNTPVTQPITVAFYSGQPPIGTLIGMQAITSGLYGCAATTAISVTWSDLGTGAHPMYIEVDPDKVINETTHVNNLTAGVFLVYTHSVYLPLVSKN